MVPPSLLQLALLLLLGGRMTTSMGSRVDIPFGAGNMVTFMLRVARG